MYNSKIEEQVSIPIYKIQKLKELNGYWVVCFSK